jgi:hypothetical protein
MLALLAANADAVALCLLDVAVSVAGVCGSKAQDLSSDVAGSACINAGCVAPVLGM